MATIATDKPEIKADPVLQYDDQRLRQVSPGVPEAMFGSPELRSWVERLNDSRKKYGGVGIAAPQIGIFNRLVVVEYPAYERVGFGLVKEQPLTAFVNPEIVWFSDEKMKAAEGCLSVLGYEAFIVRPARIGVVAYTVKGQRIEFEADNLLARVIQHEVDHLDGILYPDRVAELRDIRKIQPVEANDPVLALNKLLQKDTAATVM